MSQELREAVRRPASLAQKVRAVAWGFFGVRKSAEHERDVAQLNPVHVILAGIIGALVFVLALVFLVQWVIGSGVATR